MIELWRGNANAWECDELGHMNVKFYLAKARQAVGQLAAASGLAGIYRTDAPATLIPTALHIRFLAEARPGAPLFIEGGFDRIDEDQALLCLVMKHGGSGTVAATFRITVVHAEPATGKRFSWPHRFRRGAGDLTIETPSGALPRGLEEHAPSADVSIDRADALGLECIGRGQFVPAEMDVFGRMSAETLLGRVSDSVVNFQGAFPEEWDFHNDTASGRIGSALLETRILPRRWPCAGDGYVIRSGLVSYGPKVRNLVHWVLDPETGTPWWTMEGVAAAMDLDARKLVGPDEQVRARLDAAAKAELRP